MEPFTCRLCARVFPIAPARDRHQLRCRAQPRSRRKACEECSRSKTRCDSGLPACHRCSTLSRLCIYPLNVPVNHAQQQVVVGPPVTTSVELVSWTGQYSHDSSVAVVPELDTQQVMLYTSNTAPVLLTQQSQGHDMLDQPRSESPLSRVIGRCAQLPTEPPPDAFTNLSHVLTGQWTTAEEGLNIIERQLKRWPECLVSQVSNLPFIHWRHCCASQRSEALVTVVAIVPLYLSQTAHSHSILKESIASQVKYIYSKAAKYPPSESLAAFQATILYSIMRTLCDSTTSVPMIDEQTVRISQDVTGVVTDTAKHVLAKNIHCIDPDPNVQRGSWDGWVMEESIRRTFVALESLDMLCRARNNLSPVFCAYFCEAILPCPEHIWQASTAEYWLSQYETWETYCGRALRMRNIIQWIRGEVSGKEEQLATWFQTVGELGEVIFVCARAYVVAAGADESV